MKSGILSVAKQSFVQNKCAPRTIVAGPFRGIRMNLNLAQQTSLYLGLFERETYPWLRRLSKKIGTALDIGAAHGEYTLYFLMKTKAHKVYTFEPVAAMLSDLEGNLELNHERGSERLILSTKCVGRSSSKTSLNLDALLNDISLPCFIKMDVDGAEDEILAGATGINALPDVRWLIETHSQEMETACLRRLELAGFKTKVINNAWWRFVVPEQRPSAHNRWLAAWK
jgi:hypothetical protein